MIKKLLSTFALTCICFLLNAQQPSQIWAKTTGSTGSDAANSMALDALGNIYTLGTFTGTVDFDPGPGTFTVSSASAADTYVRKLDASGNFIWVITFKCTSTINSLAVLGSDVYFTGLFKGNIDFDPTPGGSNLVASYPTQINNVCIVKLSSAGTLTWVKTIKANNGSITSNEISVGTLTTDNLGNVFVAGSYIGNFDFNPDATATYTQSSNYGYNGYMLKLDTNGDMVWAKMLVATSTAFCWVEPACIKTDQANNLVIAGRVLGDNGVPAGTAVDYDPGAGIYTVAVTASSYDGFVCKLDAAGNFVWVDVLTGQSNKSYISFAFDATGDIYATGNNLENTVDFDPGPGVYTITPIPILPYGHAFIQKLGGVTGNLVWAKSIKDDGNAEGRGITVDNSGNVYTTGKITGYTDLDPGAEEFIVNINNGINAEVFVSKLNPNGDFAWGRIIEGTGNDYGNAIALDTQNNIYVAGFFKDTANFSSSPTGNNPIPSNGGSDAFIFKWGQCGTAQTVTATAVCKYTYQAASYTANASFYTYTTGVSGCDSLTITKVIIQPFITSTANTGNVLTCNTPNATSYQWYFCGSSFYSPLTGQTSQTFTPDNNSLEYGTFAVMVVSADGCKDTSECKPALFVGLHELYRSLSLKSFPNPVNDKLTIELSQPGDFVTVEIVDAIGRPVEKIMLTNTATIDVDLKCAPGIYFATVKTPAGQKSIKIIKE